MANTYYDSDGNKWTQQKIRSEYTKAKKGWRTKGICEALGFPHVADDPDHTISQSRCKEIHKVELIFMEGNISWSCRKAHMEWESYKSGRFSYHKNAYSRMVFTAMHDEEGFKKRYYCITNDELRLKLESLFNELTSESS